MRKAFPFLCSLASQKGKSEKMMSCEGGSWSLEPLFFVAPSGLGVRGWRVVLWSPVIPWEGMSGQNSLLGSKEGIHW